MSQSLPSCEQDCNKNTTTLDNQDNIDQQLEFQIIEKSDLKTNVLKRSKRYSATEKKYILEAYLQCNK